MTTAQTAADREEMLDELVAEFLEQVEQGTPVDRSDWLQRHADYRGELEAFFADSDRLASVLRPLNGPRAPAFSPRTPGHGERFGDYEILDEVARGGMGVVFRARQLSLQRVVALKMILSGRLASPEELQRFRLEAEAVAHLDHPNIVPVYEVGERDGWHFYSMKYIDGGSLADWKLPRPLSRADQIRVAKLLAAVALAVSHAHEHGMLHRDLKPANILLDRDGQPHVTDFGLAKRLQQAEVRGQESGAGSQSSKPTRSASEGSETSAGRPEDPWLALRVGVTAAHKTLTGTVLGTPSYMAPEQALGRKDATTAADIYSLGCILYELLTGRPPFRAETPLATLLDVLESTPERPSSLCPRLDRDLETVCLKCLEREPKKRYASASQLADDLKRFALGVPVQARSPGRTERLVRWCRREPLLASALGGLIVVFCTAFALVTWQWRRAENNFDIGQQHLGQLQTEKAEAQRQAKIALENHELAERRLEHAEGLVDKYIVGLSEDRLVRIAGTQALRGDLLEDSLKYLQSFLADRGDDPQVRLKLARSHLALALVRESLGKHAEGMHEFNQAIDLFTHLRRDDPDNDDVIKGLARALFAVGRMHGTSDVKKSLDIMRRGLDLFEKLADRHPKNLSVQDNFASATSEIGNFYRKQKDLDRARQFLERGMEIRKRILAVYPGNSKLKNNLALDIMNHAHILKDLGRLKEALPEYYQARDLRSAVVASHPTEVEYQHGLAVVLLAIGDAERLSGARDRSQVFLLEARERLEKLMAANPQVMVFQKDLARCERDLGFLKKKGSSESQACFRRARDLMEKVVKKEPATPELWNDLAGCYYDLATSLDGARAQQEILDCFDKAAALRLKVVKACPDVLVYRYDLSLTYGNLASSHWNAGRQQKALDIIELALEESKALSDMHPGVGSYRRSLAGNLGFRALFRWHTGKHDEALADVAARAKVVEGLPGELYDAARHLGTYILNRKNDGAAPDAQRRSADLAVDILRRAVDAGYSNRKGIAEENAFTTLRERDDFRKLLDSIKAP